jgi:hypothetical protein
MATVQPKVTSCLLQNVVLLYPHLFKPHQIPGTDAEAKYSSVILLPKGYDLSRLQSIMLTAAQNKWGDNARELLVRKAIKTPLRAQAEMALNGKVGFSDEEGALFFNASSNSQPGVVDGKREPILEQELIYSGVIANVQVSCFAWQHATGGRGLSFDLLNVQRVKDGPKLANAKPDPAKVFDELEPEEGEGGAATNDEELKSLFGN